MRKVLFLGRGYIGERCLDMLLKEQGKSFEVRGICSNPDTNVWWKSNSICAKAGKLGLPFISNEKKNEDEIISVINSEKIDTIISMQHWWILSEKILRMVNFQALNLHNAKLPEYKGYYTISHAILNRDKEYFSTIHWMIKEVDEGAIAFEEKTTIEDADTAVTLYKKTVESAVRGCEKLVRHLRDNLTIPKREFKGDGHFYHKAELDAAREIKNPKDSEEVGRKARALFFPPFEPAFYKTDNRKIYVLPKEFKEQCDNLDFLKKFSEKPEYIEV